MKQATNYTSYAPSSNISVFNIAIVSTPLGHHPRFRGNNDRSLHFHVVMVAVETTR